MHSGKSCNIAFCSQNSFFFVIPERCLKNNLPHGSIEFHLVKIESIRRFGSQRANTSGFSSLTCCWSCSSVMLFSTDMSRDSAMGTWAGSNICAEDNSLKKRREIGQTESNARNVRKKNLGNTCTKKMPVLFELNRSPVVRMYATYALHNSAKVELQLPTTKLW